MIIEKYPYEEDRIPSISFIENLEHKGPFYFSANSIVAIGCSKKEWKILFRHAIQMGHMMRKIRACFMWSSDDRFFYEISDYDREINYSCRDELNEFGIGQCLPFIETPYQTLLSHCYMSTPVQMYVSPPNPEDPKNRENHTSRIIPIIDARNPSCVPLITNFHSNVFCHATLQLNMGNKNNAYYVKNVVSYCSAHGFKGVVFHCGTKSNKTDEQTIENMFENIIEGLSQVRMIYSKFLLETPSGEKNEMLYEIRSFIDFVRRLRNFNENVEVCVDTCHVFQCGYDPFYYIEELINENIPIGLVHFNDSLNDIGRKVDRHASPGTGKIPVSFLKDVARLCNHMNIPMVYEC